MSESDIVYDGQPQHSIEFGQQLVLGLIGKGRK